MEQSEYLPLSYCYHYHSQIQYQSKFDYFQSQSDFQGFEHGFTEGKQVISSNQVLFQNTETIENTQKKEASSRNNNTIFKTSLSCFQKTILEVVKKDPQFTFLAETIKSISSQKNLAVFPKLVSMVRMLKKQGEVLSLWDTRKQILIENKVELLNRGKYTEKRLAQLKRTIQMMDKSLAEEKLQMSLHAYWGNHRQRKKFQKCKHQVREFEGYFRKLYQHETQQRLGQRVGKVYPKRTRKPTRSYFQ